MNNYQNALNIITSAEKFHICLGLERISKILEHLGNPQDKLKYIHIAGTNGKGSTSAILSAVLTQAGYKTGLFTSPHLLKYTERIKINGRDISDDDFAGLIFEICELAKKNDIYLTEFEILTAAAFKYFEREKIDICILETGLGGRYDATNVIRDPLCSVITSISLDHTERLGNTIDKIAFEKAGIIKENSPVVISAKNAGYKVIKDAAKLKNSPVFSPSPDKEAHTLFENNINYTVFDDKKYEFSLLGLYQSENLSLALQTLRVLNDYPVREEDLKQALKDVSWPARLQYIKSKNLIIDGAHNPDGAKVLRESLDFYFPETKRIWIYGTLKNKDYAKVVKTLFNEGDTVYVYDFQHQNHAAFEEISACAGPGVECKKLSNFAQILSLPDLKVIAGSLYMAGEVLNLEFCGKNITDLDNIY